MQKILLIKLSSLGDLLQISALTARCKEVWPDAEVTLLSGAAGSVVARGLPGVDRVIVRQPGLRGWWRTVRQLRADRYDLAVDLQGLFRSWSLIAVTDSGCRIGKGRFPRLHHRLLHRRKVPRHAVADYCSWLPLLKVTPPADPLPGWNPPGITADEETLLEETFPGKPVVVCCPFSRWPSKLWPDQHWQQLFALFAGNGWQPVVTGSVSERAKAVKLCGNNALNLCGSLSVAGFAALLQRAQGAVTMDSFAMHLCDALGTAVVALFGPTDPHRTGPCRPSSRVLQGAGCRRIPCLKRRCRYRDNRCLAFLSAGQVYREFLLSVDQTAVTPAR